MGALLEGDILLSIFLNHILGANVLGAIAFALAFIMEEEVQARDHIITTTLVIIWFTVRREICDASFSLNLDLVSASLSSH